MGPLIFVTKSSFPPMQLDLEKGMMDCLYAKCKHLTLLSCIPIIFLVN